MTSSVAPLLVVQLLFQSKHGFTGIPHVVTAVSLYLDSSVEMPIYKACRFQSIRLLDRIVIVTSGQKLTRHNSPITFSIRALTSTDLQYAQYLFTLSLKEAIAHNSFEMVKWLSTKFQGYKITAEVVTQAASLGSIKILQFFFDNDNRVAGRHFRETNRRCTAGHSIEWGGLSMASAVANSHSDVVWWLHQHISNTRFDLSAALKAAILTGNILVAEWLLARGAAWPPRVAGEYVQHDVVAQGRLDILRWLSVRDQLDGIHGLVVKAAEHGHLHVIRWLIDGDDAWNGISTRCTDLGGEASVAIHTAAIRGHLEVAQYLYVRAKTPQNDLQRELQGLEQNKTFRTLMAYLGPNMLAESMGAQTMVGAAENGLLDVVQWLCANSSAVFNQKYNFFGIRLSEKGPSTYAMDVAASKGHLDLLKYMHELPRLSVTDSARKRKRDEPARPLIPKCSQAAMDGAAANGHLDVVQWLQQNRREGCTKSAMDSAATFGRLGVIQWLHKRRSEGCTGAAMDGAATNGHLQVVQWLHYNSSSGCTTKAMDGAAANGHLEVVCWLAQSRGQSPRVFSGVYNFY
ncbi:hypothetical protein PR001_g26194 [Phytophthora rubi]|uniref:Uncharacterized protein n=1 Tax=Phytophthora rubi TaxID=129364 RepID=A0A6A3I1C7_9STRA|nr:hypothetical protein PR001_g26194 [Phytophthora rubi]